MKILSRPVVKQSCEDVVVRCLEMLHHRDFTEPKYSPPSLMQYHQSIRDIMRTLQLAGVLTSMCVGDPMETKNSTYENEEWIIQVSFSNDKTMGYIAELLFNFRR